MFDNQVIYPTERLLANPRVIQAIANMFDGPDWEVFATAFYDLMESEFLEDSVSEPNFTCPEVCFRQDPDRPSIYQVILSTGSAVELHPLEGSVKTKGAGWAAVRDEDDLGAVTAINQRLLRAIETARPDLKGDIVLCEPPTPSNGFLRDEDGDNFRGRFHLISSPETEFGFVVEVISIETDELKATVEPK